MNLEGRIAVLTGGASGLGRTAACAFERAGARVAILDRDGAGARSVGDELGGNALPFEVDVTDERSVDAAFEVIDDCFHTVQVCLNAAGVPAAGKTVHKGAALPLERFRQVVAVNLICLFDVMRHCAERMVRNKPDSTGERGVISNVSSRAAWQGQPGKAVYCSAVTILAR